MKLPNDEGDKIPIGHLLTINEASVPRLNYI